MTFHTHSDFSDGNASLDQMLAALTGAGFTHVGFTDHYAAAAAGYQRDRLDELTLSAYLDACRSRPVVVGLEVDIIGGDGPAIRERERALVDFTLGGLHSLLGVRLFQDLTPIADPRGYVHRLANELLDAMATGRLDAVAHPTKLPEAIRPHARELLDDRWRAPLIDAAARLGIAFDVNEDSRVPDAGFLADCRQAGVKLLIGSDAHSVTEARPLNFVGRVCEAAGVVESDLFLPGSHVRDGAA